jgi:hypothetical protein
MLTLINISCEGLKMIRLLSILIIIVFSFIPHGYAAEGLNSMSGTSLPIGAGGNTAMWVTPAGNIGIGTNAPQTNFEVAGEVRIDNTSVACSSSNEGAMRYNSSLKVMQFCNGTTWRVVGEETAGMFECSGGTADCGGGNSGVTCTIANYKTWACSCPDVYSAQMQFYVDDTRINSFDTGGDGLIHTYYVLYLCR